MSYIEYDDDDFDPEELYCYDEDGDECYENQKSWG